MNMNCVRFARPAEARPEARGLRPCDGLSVCLFVSLSVYVFVCLSCLFVRPSVSLSGCLSVGLRVGLSVGLWRCLGIRPSVCPSVFSISLVHSWSIRCFQGSILGIVSRDVGRSCSRVCLTVCLAVFLGVCWLHWACTGSLAVIFGSSRRCQGSILGHLGSPGVDFEASWAPF